MPDIPLTVLVILDGYGVAPATKGNAITQAKQPGLFGLLKRYPSTILQAAGTSVGLPAGQVGNSEAGHMNIGAGRLVLQDDVRVTTAISNGTFFKNPALLEGLRAAKARRSKLHIMGLVSAAQSAHADPDHLLALMTLVRAKRLPRVYLHLFTDGRDANPRRGLSLIEGLRRGLSPQMHIASVIGRHYAMDRKKAWKNTEQAYDCLTAGAGLIADDPVSAVQSAYDRGETDEFILPTVIRPFAKTGRIGKGDVVIFFNLRSDRARQLTKAFVQPHFNVRNPGSFRRKRLLTRLTFIAMTDFGPDLGPILTAFPSEDIKNTLPLALSGLRQLYVAETEKYAHLTYFFNGGYDHAIAGEERIVVSSPRVAHYDATPAMSAAKIAAKVLQAIKAGQHGFIGVNFSNADMLGHTGNLLATIKSIEFMDVQIEAIARAVLDRGGLFLLTGDHGNAEEMLDFTTGDVNTEHSMNPVPFVVAQSELAGRLTALRPGQLGDIAPTLLQRLGLRKPAVMTGESLWR